MVDYLNFYFIELHKIVDDLLKATLEQYQSNRDAFIKKEPLFNINNKRKFC